MSGVQMTENARFCVDQTIPGVIAPTGKSSIIETGERGASMEGSSGAHGCHAGARDAAAAPLGALDPGRWRAQILAVWRSAMNRTERIKTFDAVPTRRGQEVRHYAPVQSTDDKAATTSTFPPPHHLLLL